MARPTTVNASKLSIWLGDGATPTENFSAPCGLTTRKIQFTTKTGEVVVFDCDNPDDPGVIERVAQSKSCAITGSGLLAKAALPTWRPYGTGGVSKTIRFAIDMEAIGYFEGKFICTTFGLGGEQGNKTNVDLTLDSDGDVIWHDAPA